MRRISQYVLAATLVVTGLLFVPSEASAMIIECKAESTTVTIPPPQDWTFGARIVPEDERAYCPVSCGVGLIHQWCEVNDPPEVITGPPDAPDNT